MKNIELEVVQVVHVVRFEEANKQVKEDDALVEFQFKRILNDLAVVAELFEAGPPPAHIYPINLHGLFDLNITLRFELLGDRKGA